MTPNRYIMKIFLKPRVCADILSWVDLVEFTNLSLSRRFSMSAYIFTVCSNDKQHYSFTRR
jgi:hypothetical protein